jgi:formate C-acetyltransferase
MGAMQGTDVSGPTALLRSVARMPLWKCVGSPVVNIGMSPQLLQQRDAVAALIRTFFQMGGMQLQITVTDKDTLRDAMKHPEAHRSLMVRVSGYSARFTELEPNLQEEILSRTIH